MRQKNTMVKSQSGQLTVGIDLGDKFSHYCILDRAGEVLEEGRIRTTADARRMHCGRISTIVVQCAWPSRLARTQHGSMNYSLGLVTKCSLRTRAISHVSLKAKAIRTTLSSLHGLLESILSCYTRFNIAVLRRRRI